MKVLIIGHVTEDHFKDGIVTGGPPNYQIPVFLANGWDVDVVTSSAVDYPLRFDEVRYYTVSSDVSTTFAFEFNKVAGEIHRTLRLLKRATKLDFKEFSSFIYDKYDLIIISPVAQEVSIQTMERLRDHTEFLAIDIQGFSRTWDESKNINTDIEISLLNKICSIANLVKVSENELSGINPEFLNLGTCAMIITSSGENIEYITEDLIFRHEAERETDIEDDTGAGDIFLAGYCIAASQGDFRNALAYGDEIARASLHYRGIPKVTDIKLFKVGSQQE